MSKIQITDLTFAYPGSFENVFENVSLTLDSDWKLGLIGRNGRGKTTLLRLLLGEYSSSGQITAAVDFCYFPYTLPDPARTASEQLEELDGQYTEWKVIRELNLLKADPGILYRPFATLSGGEQAKVLLAALFSRDNAFLLLDEPTNHLDVDARELLAAYLAKKAGYILVSHDRSLLDACTDHILSIRKTKIELCQGNFSAWYEEARRREQSERERNEKLKGEIARLEEGARRAAGWSAAVEKTKKGVRNAGLRPDTGYIGHKSAKMMQRAKNIEKRRLAAAEEKAGLLQDAEPEQPLKLSPLPYRSRRLAVLQDLCLFYDDRQVAGPLRLEVEQGDRICLAGSNGCGKSSVLKLLADPAAAPRHTGLLEVSPGLIVSYVPQDAGFLGGDLAAYAAGRGIDKSLFFTILRKFGFPRPQLEKDMAGYSGGQKKKVLLAASLCQSAHLYVWDEPLNFVDLESRIQLEELLLQYHPTLLFVEHDRVFAEKIATKTLTL